MKEGTFRSSKFGYIKGRIGFSHMAIERKLDKAIFVLFKSTNLVDVPPGPEASPTRGGTRGRASVICYNVKRARRLFVFLIGLKMLGWLS